ncbi:hypothetical protein EYF80_022675 [Liparis tanakae]|uniref:Uncharacterized protein n=1 Tax=Liparis tanakae TaxID=230148 RepID=A0A4Z2HPG3_9TELE|nr:hypothetical protein EYF80_022675 [Liparis tanakae]
MTCNTWQWMETSSGAHRTFLHVPRVQSKRTRGVESRKLLLASDNKTATSNLERRGRKESGSIRFQSELREERIAKQE